MGGPRTRRPHPIEDGCEMSKPKNEALSPPSSSIIGHLLYSMSIYHFKISYYEARGWNASQDDHSHRCDA